MKIAQYKLDVCRNTDQNSFNLIKLVFFKKKKKSNKLKRIAQTVQYAENDKCIEEQCV